MMYLSNAISIYQRIY